MKVFLIIVAALCLVTLVNVIIESLRENKKISFSTYRINDKRLKKDVKIVMISDLHNASYGEHNQKLIHAIESIDPDIVLVAGDVIVGKPGISVDIGIEFLNALGERFPVYVGKGNHEMRASLYSKYGDMWIDLYEHTCDKVNWLINDSVFIKEYNITIHGLDLKPEYYRRFKKLHMDDAYLKSELGVPDSRRYNILIGHDPDYFPEYAKWGADLTVSGHVHGGLIILPCLGGLISPMIRFFPKYYKGDYSMGNSHMIVSAGLGLHTLKIRVNNQPDLVTINLVK